MGTQRPTMAGNPLKSTPPNIISRPAAATGPPNSHHAYCILPRLVSNDSKNIKSSSSCLQHRFYDRQSFPSLAPVRAVAHNGDLYSSSIDDEVEVGSILSVSPFFRTQKLQLEYKY